MLTYGDFMKNFNIKKILKIIKDFIINNKETIILILFLVLPFITIDLFTRISTNKINFYKITKLVPNLFNISWYILFIGLTLSFKKKIGKKIYLVTIIISLLMFLTHNIYYPLTRTIFDFNLLESASEGSPYIIDTLKNTKIITYIFFIIIIYLSYIAYKKIPYKTKNNNKNIIIILLIFIILHSICPLLLGRANKVLTWSSWKNPRNIYNSFNDSNKSFQVSGFYEYNIRNFYVTFLKTKEQKNEEDLEFLADSYTEATEKKNKYTGKYKGKNLIIVQFEGLDDWILTKETTPTIYNLLNSSINFTNHYSYYNGGGSTFNSEFAVNTGFITPLSYTQNAYTFNKNEFPYTLAKLFKQEGYSVNAFHMNNGEYYSRTTNYKNWGYDNYYGLKDLGTYTNQEYKLDRELVLNELFNEKMFNTETPFIDYVITYSGHLPFTNTKEVCKMLYDEDNANNPNVEFVEMTELECIKRQNQETDYMVKLLINNLKEKGLYDNTVIVFFSDHYLYTVNDKTILDKYKNTSNNLINKTPFFIWSKDTKKESIKKVTSQLEILPTILNLFGIKYNPNNYIGKNALANNYEGIAFFSDYSWYDGNVYVENGEVTNKKKISKNKLEEKNYYVSYITKKNDLTLKYNYFKKIKDN